MQKYSALLTVDAERFSAHRDADLPGLHMEIRRALAAACAVSGLGQAWDAVRFLQSTGDGLLAVLPAEALPALVHPFPKAVQEALAAAAPELRAQGLRLRLRVALHAGLVDDEREDAPGISTATIDVCRLVDSAPLRDALKTSDPDVTFAAVLLSEEVFRPYVAGGHTGLQESQFTEVLVSVKQYSRNAYLWVPEPSRGPGAPSGDGPSGPTGGEPSGPSGGGGSPAPAGPVLNGVTVSGPGSRSQFGNVVHGDLSMG
ncbi:hypothetical protein [Actinocorallia aurea]